MTKNLNLDFNDMPETSGVEHNHADDNSVQVELFSQQLVTALANHLFPELDSQLRAGKHINANDLENYAYLVDYQIELEEFYQRYNVDLIKAPENFFYLRPRSTTFIARSILSELEMLVGKVLCYLYLSPERLAQQGIFTIQEVYDELLNLSDENKLLKLINQRSSGSDLDKQKLAEKVKSALSRLRRVGMIKMIGDVYSNKFIISEAVFRFGADVRSGEDVRAAQLNLIRYGEATNKEILDSMKNQEVTNNEDEQEI